MRIRSSLRDGLFDRHRFTGMTKGSLYLLRWVYRATACAREWTCSFS